jgi:hypothetical protein
MKRRMLAAVAALALFTTACAPRYQATITPTRAAARSSSGRDADGMGQDVWRRLAQQLPPAAVVRVLLADGTRLKAIVLAVDDEAIVVKPRTRVPEPQRRIPYSTIEALELDTNRGIGAGKAAAIGIGTGAATFMALILLSFALLSD